VIGFWNFANNHEFITLLCAVSLLSCIASSVKHVSRALSRHPVVEKASGKTNKASRTDAKAPEKAH
jgi:hypothetical protein